jgi:hydrogenase maturation factor
VTNRCGYGPRLIVEVASLEQYAMPELLIGISWLPKLSLAQRGHQGGQYVLVHLGLLMPIEKRSVEEGMKWEVELLRAH